MRYQKELNIWKGHGIILNLNTMEAWSFGWWQFLRKINNVVYFNAFPLNMFMRKHQQYTRRILDNMKINYVVVKYKAGLQNLKQQEELFQQELFLLQDAIEKKNSRSKKNNERLQLINKIYDDLSLLYSLDPDCT